MSMSRPYFLMTDRLGFRCWSKSDLSLANELWGDAEVTSLIGGPFTPEQIEERLSKEIATMIALRVQYWPVFLLRTDEHVGCAGLRPYRPEAQFYELGIHLRPAYWGRGLAQEAGRTLINYAFKTLGAKALFAGHHPLNTKSRRVIEKLGFQFTREEFYPPTGLKHRLYVLTKS
jgi:RimJ/RimL family protein N-acetyltransferase